MNTLKIISIKIKCPFCKTINYVKTDKFEEWDMVGNIREDGNTFAFDKCINCGKKFCVHQKPHDSYTIGKIKVHAINH